MTVYVKDGNAAEIISDPRVKVGADGKLVSLIYGKVGTEAQLFYSRDPITDTFDASGTWTKRPGIVRVVVYGLHAGAGGNGRGLSQGAGGGGGGGWKIEFIGSAVPASAAVVIGAGGAGSLLSIGHGGNGGVVSFNGVSSGGGGMGASTYIFTIGGGPAQAYSGLGGDGGLAGSDGYTGGDGESGDTSQNDHFPGDGGGAAGISSDANGRIAGGNSLGVDGALAIVGSSVGVDGGIGAGGSGSGRSTIDENGPGDGGNGIIIVENWYY